MLRSDESANETCETTSACSQTVVATGLPDNASQVAFPTKFKLDGVGTTVTKNPSSCSRRSRSQALYAAIPALTPSTTSRPRGKETGAPDMDIPKSGLFLVLGFEIFDREKSVVDFAHRYGQRFLMNVSFN